MALELTDIPWTPGGAPVVEDAIYSLLVEGEFGVYITPNLRSLYVLIRGRGLIHARGDFESMDDEELNDLVNDIVEAYSA